MRLFDGLIMFALVWIASAFYTPQLLSSRQHKTILTCSAADPGRRLYDAAYAGDVTQMKIVLAECKGKPDQLNWASPERSHPIDIHNPIGFTTYNNHNIIR